MKNGRKRQDIAVVEDQNSLQDIVDLQSEGGSNLMNGTSVEFWDRMNSPFDISGLVFNKPAAWLRTKKDINNFPQAVIPFLNDRRIAAALRNPDPRHTLPKEIRYNADAARRVKKILCSLPHASTVIAS